MKQKKKTIISWLLVLIILSTIFIFSNMTSKESNTRSKQLISTTIITIVRVTTHKELSREKITSLVNKLNHPLRKCAHATIYYILAIFLFHAYKNTNIKEFKKIFFLTILTCFLYSLLDEYHQTFIQGRTGQFSDCLIDTAGACLGSITYVIFIKILLKHKHLPYS